MVTGELEAGVDDATVAARTSADLHLHCARHGHSFQIAMATAAYTINPPMTPRIAVATIRSPPPTSPMSHASR